MKGSDILLDTKAWGFSQIVLGSMLSFQDALHQSAPIDFLNHLFPRTL